MPNPFRLPRLSRRNALRGAVALSAICAVAAATGHGSTAGEIVIGHPFATPSPPGATTGAAYLTTLENGGDKPDRLVRASTPVAARVEMHTMNVDAQGVMRMREIDAIGLAPKQVVLMRPGGGMHLMLIDLKTPLKNGDTFPMSLQFERAGKVEVNVVVQIPRPRDAAPKMHMH